MAFATVAAAAGIGNTRSPGGAQSGRVEDILARASASKIASLEDENERLRARLQQLKAALGEPFAWPPEWRLTRGESVVFDLLMRRDLVDRSAAVAAIHLARHRENCGSSKVVDVLVCRMRRKLAPYGITIETRWGYGHFLSPETKRVAEAHLNGRLPRAAGASLRASSNSRTSAQTAKNVGPYPTARNFFRMTESEGEPL